MPRIIDGVRCTMGGLPICRRCQRGIRNPADNDAEEHRMHIECAEEKRAEEKRKNAEVPIFDTMTDERAYYRIKFMDWLFLCERW